MVDLLQENLMYLYHHKIDIFNQIQSYLEKKQEKNCKLIFNEDGTVNLSYALVEGTKMLYSDDQSDIEQWLQDCSHLHQGEYDIVMYGLGLSHHLAKLIELNPKLNFYIVEPEIDIFLEALKVLQIDQLLQHPQIKLLVVGNQHVEFKAFYLLVNTYSSLSQVDLFIPYYAEINLDDMRAFYEFNYLSRESRLIEIGFERMFGTQPYRNSIQNIEGLLCSNSIEVLKNKFDGCTALIVGGGPSLAEDIEKIRGSRDKLLIIAAGSSIQALKRFGIEPHLMVSMDPGSANGNVYKNIDTSSIPLIFVPQIYANILELHPELNFFAFFQNDMIIEYLFSDLRVDYNFVPTNSVSGTAIQVAKYLGSKRILLAGQDCSFPNNQYYAHGTEHIGEGEVQKKLTKGSILVENVMGTTNYTDLSMKAVLENIERLIPTIENVDFINTSSLGAKIKGADYLPFLEVIQSIEPNQYDFNEIKVLAEKTKNVNGLQVEDVLSRVENIIKECELLIQYSKSSLKLIDKVDEQSRKLPNKAMTTLSKLEQQFSMVTRHALFENVITAWNRGLTRSYDQQVIRIEAEPTIIGKAKLLNEIVVPFIEAIIHSFHELIKEFQQLQSKLILLRQ